MTLFNQPFFQTDALRREMERAFPGFFWGDGVAPFSMTAFLPGRKARGYPLLNLSEDKDGYYVEALAPGVDPEKLSITAAHNVLTVSGEKVNTAEEKETQDFHRRERATGKFVRTITLPEEIDADKITAKYKDGLLLISAPKVESAKPRQIEVSVN